MHITRNACQLNKKIVALGISNSFIGKPTPPLLRKCFGFSVFDFSVLTMNFILDLVVFVLTNKLLMSL